MLHLKGLAIIPSWKKYLGRKFRPKSITLYYNTKPWDEKMKLNKSSQKYDYEQN